MKEISSASEYKDYGWQSASATHMHRHFMPHIFDVCGQVGNGTRVLDVGCGNGFLAGALAEQGYSVVGIDLSEQGITLARKQYPQARFEVLAADDQVLENLESEPFDILISTEVVEHLYAPRNYIRGCYGALKPRGLFICTTPYHGYVKNLAIALCGAWDRHADPLWDGGHIKLWSRQTLTRLLSEAGFVNVKFKGVGRFPLLWMTMMLSGEKPVTDSNSAAAVPWDGTNRVVNGNVNAT